VASLAPALGVTAESIRARLAQPWVRPDTFVPIRTIGGALLDAARPKLVVIEGVQLQPTRLRA
jgi:hypothetical protein